MLRVKDTKPLIALKILPYKSNHLWLILSTGFWCFPDKQICQCQQWALQGLGCYPTTSSISLLSCLPHLPAVCFRRAGVLKFPNCLCSLQPRAFAYALPFCIDRDIEKGIPGVWHRTNKEVQGVTAILNEGLNFFKFIALNCGSPLIPLKIHLIASNTLIPLSLPLSEAILEVFHECLQLHWHGWIGVLNPFKTFGFFGHLNSEELEVKRWQIWWVRATGTHHDISMVETFLLGGTWQ